MSDRATNPKPGEVWVKVAPGRKRKGDRVMILSGPPVSGQAVTYRYINGIRHQTVADLPNFLKAFRLDEKLERLQ